MRRFRKKKRENDLIISNYIKFLNILKKAAYHILKCRSNFKNTQIWYILTLFSKALVKNNTFCGVWP